MGFNLISVFSVAVFLGMFLGLSPGAQATVITLPTTKPAWEKIASQYHPVELGKKEVAALGKTDRAVLDKLVQASEYIHALYLRQVWSGNAELLKKLQADTSPLSQLQLRVFHQNAGPWSSLNDDVPLFASVKARPPGAGFYPESMTKVEFETWVSGLDASAKKQAQGEYWVIERRDGKLVSHPYHEAYAEWVAPAAKHLKEAAALTANESLKKFLNLRADALLNDNYFQSDVAWLDVDSKVDVTFGPYETYDDKLFGYKASYEAFIGLVDAEHTQRLGQIAKELQYLENQLPLDERYKNKSLGKASPIRILNLVYSAGDARSGVMTAAFNLPNDEKVLAQHGSKKVMLKNVQRAKFDHILRPLAQLAVAPKHVANLDFEAFFTHILAHELAHGLGPHDIKVNGTATTVRQELKNQYAALEEAKADILGLFALEKLLEKGAVARDLKRTLYSTYLASTFRSVRFGIEEAHGRGTALQFNYLWDMGAIHFDKDKSTFSIVDGKISAAVRDLTAEILLIQAEGSYAKAKALLDKYAVVRPEMKAILEKARSIPVDIEPRYALKPKT
jgi:hypothetical protein